MLKIISLIVAILILVFSIISWWGGVFDTLTLKEESVGPFQLVYREYQGPYSGARYLVKTVATFLKENPNLNITQGFTLFFDDPSISASKSLRYSAGAVVDTFVSVKPPYKYAVFKKTNAIVGTFPIRSYFSYVLGVYKLNSALNDYCIKKKCDIVKPILEIYDFAGAKRIIYIVPVGREDSPAPDFRL